VASQCQFETAAHAHAADGGNHRFGCLSTSPMSMRRLGYATALGVPNSRMSAPPENPGRRADQHHGVDAGIGIRARESGGQRLSQLDDPDC
jgi:hypothetical protein